MGTAKDRQPMADLKKTPYLAFQTVNNEQHCLSCSFNNPRLIRIMTNHHALRFFHSESFIVALQVLITYQINHIKMF